MQFKTPQSTTIASSQGQVSRGPIICHNCGKPGYVQANCKSKPRPQLSPTACYECGQEGHIKKNCPRRQGAGGLCQGRPSQSTGASQSSRVSSAPTQQGAVPQGSRAGSTAPRDGGQ